MNQDNALFEAVSGVSPIPRDSGGPIFREPWEAQAFAMTLALHEAKFFTWEEWASTLSDEIRRAQREGDTDLGDTYYRHWLAALEGIVAEKGIASPATLASRKAAWSRAAWATPHGSPILLSNDPDTRR